jgi:hypothetical protein
VRIDGAEIFSPLLTRNTNLRRLQMELSRQAEMVVMEVSQTADEIVQLPELELAMIGGGVADITFS